MQGGAGDDTIKGSLGNDVLGGGTGRDVVQGGSGSDWLEGNEGDDWLEGEDGWEGRFGDGWDTLRGGTGNDTLTGGTGTDSFVIEGWEMRAGERDVIADFNPWEGDRVVLPGFGTTLANDPAGFTRLTTGWGYELQIWGLGAAEARWGILFG